MSYDRAAAMLSYVGLYYQQSRIYQSQNDAKAAEFNTVRSMIDEVAAQFFVETATWGIDRWEKYCGLHPNNGDRVETRRQRVISWLQILSPITPCVMKRICEAVTGCFVQVTENVAPYTFRVEYDIIKPFDLRDLFYVIEEAKPAHLAMESIVARYSAACVCVVNAVAAGSMCYEASTELSLLSDYQAGVEIRVGCLAQSTAAYETEVTYGCR